MLIKTNAIVLSKLKYRDNDLIVKCYTKQKGVVSYIVRGAFKTQKGSAKAVYFQPLSQLQFDGNYKENRSLQSISEVKLDSLYQTLHTNILKSAIAMFLSEVLSTVLQEEEQNEALFSYLEHTFNWLDHETEFSNFHLLFLLNLTKYLGFYPDTQNMDQSFFNLSNGLFEPQKQDMYSISGENLTILKQLLGTNFDAIHTVKLNSKQRQSFLNMLLLYFELHLGDFRKPKSLQIFNQVFN
ncbi:DNA replication and repair protein RecO [Flavobacteriaceae bacterium MAR_2010_72]|nr:DNA replication and repair protein RecO [Flavobacteriaceae bacterium MAR_2010_72]TVZ58118.1 DNA replication and repair protein RecO [Flavobacteriaceae bacterium MAR_2010_105]